MRILAIDPGSMLGWATDATGRLEWGTEDFRVKSGESSGNRWRRFGEWLLDITLHESPTKMYLGSGGSRSIEMAIEPTIDLVVYERTTFVAPGRKAYQDIIYGFTSRLEEHCERHGITLQPVAVQTLKAFAIPKMNRKKGDPRMDRSKEAMIAAARNKLILPVASPGEDPFDPKVLRGFQNFPALLNITEHEADALWLYFYCKEVILASR